MAVCPECGTALPHSAPEGLCSKCLLEQGLRIVVASASPAAPAEPVNVLREFGDYQLLEEIARGGMGVVYKARQKSLDRIVAVKTLLLGLHASPEVVKRLRAEATVAASLHHPNIVGIHEVGVHQGEHYLVMDFIGGPNLAQFVKDQPLSPRGAATYLKSIAEAVHYAHERGVLHRDLKPSNVLIDSDDQPRVTDFGLAKRLTFDSPLATEHSSLTLSGQMLGSPSYMPPEQASATRHKIGRRSDVYSLGAMLYHMHTGRPPFVAQSLTQTLDQVINHEPISPRLLNPAVPRDLETICLKCLEKEPARRYGTARELADELGRFLRDEPILARPVGFAGKAWRWGRRKPALAGSLSAAVLLLLVVAIGSPIAIFRIARAKRQAEENLYVANVRQANEALEAHDWASARDIFQRVEASPQQRAMRGWEWRYLAERLRSDELATVGRHDSWPADLAVARDRRRAATISEDGVVKLWDLADRKEIHWPAHPSHVTNLPDRPYHALIFTPDDSALISSGSDKVIRFWDVASRMQIGNIEVLSAAMIRLAISPDAKLLAGQSYSSHVCLWSLAGARPELLARMTNNLVVGLGVAFSPDNKTLFVGGVDAPVLRYDLSRPESPVALAPLAGSMPPFAFAPDGKSLVTAGASRRIIRRWTWPELMPLPELRVLSGQARAFAFSPDGGGLATGLYDGQINFWDLANGATNQPVALHGHEDGVMGIEFVPRDGKMELVSVSLDRTLRLWDPAHAKRNEFVIHLGGSVKAVAFSPDSRYLATVVGEPVADPSDLNSKPYRLQLWAMASRLPVASTSFGGNGLGPQIAFSPDGTRLAVGDYAILQFHDVPSLGRIATVGERDAVFDPNGQWLAYVVNTKIIKRASLDAPEIVLATQPDEINQLTLSPDGRTLASSSVNGPLYLWDARNGRLQAKLPGHEQRAGALDFSPDGKTLVSAGWEGLLGIWNVAGPRKLGLFRSHNRLLSSAVFSPDGRTIATAGDDTTVRLWNVARRQEVMVLHGHTDAVINVAFSRDDQWLASASDDGTVRLWRAPSFDEIRAAEREAPNPNLQRSSKSQSPSSKQTPSFKLQRPE